LVDPQGLEDAETVLPMGDILLLGTRDFLAIDIRNPMRPTIVKRISDRPRIDKINGMALRGDYVFTANKSGYVTVFDVSNPANPRLHDTLDAVKHGDLQSPHDIATFGDRIVVVNAAHRGPVHMQIYRVADPQTHELLPASQWVLEGAVRDKGIMRDDLGGANRVALAGPFACVGAFVCDRVGLVDISNPRKPVQVANMPAGDIDATGMTVSGKLLWVAGGQCVEAIDLSNPLAPVSVAQYRGGRLFATRRLIFKGQPRFDNAHDLVYRDGYVYATAQNDNQFGILKLNDPRLIELAD
jgi:hypothetical protein